MAPQRPTRTAIVHLSRRDRNRRVLPTRILNTSTHEYRSHSTGDTVVYRSRVRTKSHQYQLTPGEIFRGVIKIWRDLSASSKLCEKVWIPGDYYGSRGIPRVVWLQLPARLQLTPESVPCSHSPPQSIKCASSSSRPSRLPLLRTTRQTQCKDATSSRL